MRTNKGAHHQPVSNTSSKLEKKLFHWWSDCENIERHYPNTWKQKQSINRYLHLLQNFHSCCRKIIDESIHQIYCLAITRQGRKCFYMLLRHYKFQSYIEYWIYIVRYAIIMTESKLVVVMQYVWVPVEIYWMDISMFKKKQSLWSYRFNQWHSHHTY